jgi:hypothetical protein
MTDTDTHEYRIEYMPLADLLARRHPRNPKDHDLAGIDQSFDRFGFADPILLCERTGLVAGGHGRLEVLQARANQQGSPDAPGAPALVRTNGDGGDWLVPTVRGWASTDDDELLAWVVTTNHLGAVGGWVTDSLATILSELGNTDQGLPPGWSPDDLETLLAEVGADVLPEGDTDADYADDLSGRGDPAAPRDQQGLHEVGLMFQSEAHAEYVGLVNELRQAWGAELPSPMVVLRALRMARDQL